MQIAILGIGNVGNALGAQWQKAGHTILIGARDPGSDKTLRALAGNPAFIPLTIAEAVARAQAVLIATPPTAIFDLLPAMGDLGGKTVIDATNAVRQKPDPYPTVYHALRAQTKAEVVKCFNSTGFENMQDPIYHGEGIDMFMAGDSDSAKAVAEQLARDAGFGACWDFGKGDKVELLEQFALSWINLAIMQGHGRNLAFRLVKR